MLGYLAAKNFLGFQCAHKNDPLDNLFLTVLTTTSAILLRALGICHLYKIFCCCAEGLVALLFVDALL